MVGEISKSILYGVSESAKSEGEYKLLRITDIQNNAVDWDTVPYTDFDEHKANAYLINDGDILFARTGATVGKSYLVKGLQDKVIYASYLIRVQTFSEILPEYVKYFFESGFYWEQIQKSSVGIGQPNVNGTILSQLEIPIPPFDEQKRIVNELEAWLSIIDAIDNGKIELQIAIKLAKSKILDLAIHGKLVPQDLNDEPASELLKRINPKAEITCDTPQYGKLPKGWCLCKISSVVDIVNGKSQKNVESPTGKYPIYGSGGVIGKAMEYTCLAGSTIIGRKGTINHPIFVEENFWNVDTAFGMKANNQILEDKYFYCFCLYFDFSKLDKSSALPSLTKTAIGNLIFPIPPLAEQQRIVAKIEELFAQLDKIESSLQA